MDERHAGPLQNPLFFSQTGKDHLYISPKKIFHTCSLSMAQWQGNGNLLPWSRENKRGGKPQLQTRSQTAARATRREGCGGAASDACGCPWPGEVLPQCLQPAISHRALLLPVKCVLLRSQVNSEAQSCPEPRQLCHCCCSTC